MTQQVINVGSAINDGTGDPARTAFTKSNDNFTELYARGSATTPQGRLTLTSGTPVMTASAASATVMYYTPYVGNKIPIYDGSNFTITTFSELSVLANDTTKSPAAIGASKVNDWFVWSDAGTLRIGHGPDWTSDTSRSAGTALVRVNGLWLNNVSITNGPAAQRGTYVGTTRSDTGSTPNWVYGAVSANGLAGFFGVWNAYNRVLVASRTGDNTDNWVYNAAAWRAANASNTMRCSFVRGLDEDAVFAQYTVTTFGTAGAFAGIAVALDSTTASAGTSATTSSTAYLSGTGTYSALPGLGFHFLQAIEYSVGGTGTTFLGDSGGVIAQNGLNVLFLA